MISYLTGEIVELDFNHLTILTSGGVGYDVGISELIYSKLTLGEETDIHVYHHITEGHQALFGFLDTSEKNIFIELIKISGIGGKVAMQMLSLGAPRLVGAVQSGDNKTIESIKGIGKKMAEKVILELKDKDFIITSESGDSVTHRSGFTDVVTTLVNMGYNRADVEKILSTLPDELDDIGEIIPYVIKNI